MSDHRVHKADGFVLAAAATPDPQHVIFPHSHHARDLAAFTIRSLSEDVFALKYKQYIAVMAVHTEASSLFRPELYQQDYPSNHPPRIPPEALMAHLITLFSDIFFLGELTGIAFLWDWDLLDRVGGIGEYRENTIRIHPQSCLSDRNPGVKMVGILLHECTHAFYARFAAYKSPRNALDGSARTYLDPDDDCLGHTGHGSSWAELASHIEATAKALIHPEINISLMEGILFEIKSTRLLPTPDSIARCHVNSQKQVMDSIQQRVPKEVTMDMFLAHIPLKRRGGKVKWNLYDEAWEPNCKAL